LLGTSILIGVVVILDIWVFTMYRLGLALLIVSNPAFAQDKVEEPVTLQSCYPIGQTVRGELIYSLDCKAITPQPAEAAREVTVVPPGEVKASIIEHTNKTPVQPPK
jgi:hypothetical protein